MSAAPPAPKIEAMPLGRKLRYWLETAGFFLIIGFFRLFSIDRASAIGGWIGRKLVAPTGLSRRAVENLTAAFPEKSEAEIAAILDGMWDNLGRVMGEYAHLDNIHWAGASPRIEMEGHEHYEAAKARGKGIIFISGHFANWETMPIAARERGIQGGQVYRPTNNPYVNRWLYKLRTRNGLPEMISKGAAGTRRIFTILRKSDSILMMVDQRASEGIPAPFFGRDVMTTPVPAALALKLGAVILPVSNERIGGARFRIRAYPVIETPNTGDPDRDLLECTEAINAFIEQCVRAQPSQWLWIHKRWDAKGAPLRKRAQALAPMRGGANNAASKRV
ncbi:MAG: lauroyl acyltransferase [Alphaproteobacteria bacterium]|nr:lauroyl acyltransferase [Alphaproteobacteria bacterium]